MVRLLIVLMLFVLTILPISAQEEKAPAYALTFHAGDRVRVAVFSESNGWEVQTIPNFILFGQYDISLVLPTWTADGQLIGVGYDPAQTFTEEAMYSAPAIYLYRYDVVSESLESMAEPIGASMGESLTPPILAVSSISPDGRYATLYDLLNLKGYLVDLENEQVLFTLDTCGLKAFHWTESSVFLGSYAAYISCPPSFFEYDLTSGEITMDMSETLATQDITVFEEGVWVGESSFLMSSYGLEEYFKLVHIQPDGAEIIAPMDFMPVVTSGSQQAAAFSSAGMLMYLDLATMEVFEIGTTESNPIMFFVDEMLHYSAAIPAGNVVQYGHGVYQPGTEPEFTVLYEGAASDYAFSSTLTAIAIRGVDNSVQIYDEAGMVWDSVAAGVELKESNLHWSDDGDWLHINQEAGTTSVNLLTGEATEPPELYARYLSASPDGQWFLYMVREPGDDDSMYQSERLFVYNPQTQELVTLVDGENLYDNFHFPLDGYFIWSPLLE